VGDLALADGVLAGHVASAARLIRGLEDARPEAYVALRALYPKSGRAHVVGVTGPPGAGKSTLVTALVAGWRRRGRRVGVLAVDPSSPFSGGALLGDRVRMQQHATDPGVFIRSMASRGHAGGLARASGEASGVFDAMGFDVVVVETVGVGQGEIEVVSLAHTTLLVCLPGSGDAVQASKAGLLEAADVWVLNKGDAPGADEAMRHLHEAMPLAAAGAWQKPLLRTVASRGEGTEAVLDTLAEHRRHLTQSGALRQVERRRARAPFLSHLRERLAARLDAALEDGPELEALWREVEARSLDPYTAAERWLSRAELPR
jgi:LAO/AO transport system kinase